MKREDISIESKLFKQQSLIAKRTVDLLLGTLLLLICSPVILLILLWIRIDSPGNPIFSQIRIGRKGKPFTIYKMRTLYVHHFGIVPEEEEPVAFRITRAGKFLRRSKLDELPQLLNVILGTMSLVGPRPDIPEQVVDYTFEQKRRLLVKPGMSGLTQVSGNTMLSWPDRIRLDIWYIENWSFLLDIRIIFLTLIPIFQGESLNSDPLQLHSTLPDRKAQDY